MNKSSIEENQAIQEGLERFLDMELLPEDSVPARQAVNGKKELKTEFVTSPQQVRPAATPVQRQVKPVTTPVQRQVKPAVTPVQQELYVEEEEEEVISQENIHKKKEKSNRPKKKKSRTSKKTKKGNKKGGNKKNKKEKKSKWKKFLVVLLVVVAILFLVWYSLIGKVYKQMNYEKVQGLASEPMKQDGVTNVLLIGNDSRENGNDGRSDAMILLSISNETKTIHMTSLLRDMYVDIPGYDGNRLNAAYAYGGPALLCETIEQNFGIEVNRYVLVNFQAFAALVDAVGGIDMEVTNEEVQWINAYLNEYNMLEGREMTTDYLDTSLSGEIHLNGPQALAYSRNRYIGTDFGRTERQRKVLSAVIGKLPVAFATGGDELLNELLPNLTTNLTQMEVFGLSGDAGKLFTYEIVQTVIPADGTYSNATIRGMSVLEVDFEANKQILQRDIYGKE